MGRCDGVNLARTAEAPLAASTSQGAPDVSCTENLSNTGQLTATDRHGMEVVCWCILFSKCSGCHGWQWIPATQFWPDQPVEPRVDETLVTPVANETVNEFAAIICCLGTKFSEAVNMGPAFTTEANWNDHGRHSERGQGCPNMLTR